MFQLIELLARLIEHVQQQWNVLAKKIDKPTARILAITMTLLIVFEVMWLTLLLTLYLLRS